MTSTSPGRAGRTVTQTSSQGVAGRVWRVVLADGAAVGGIVGTVPTDAALAEVARAVAEATSPDSDVHASGAYRRRLVAVLTRRALAEAIGRASDTGAAA